MRAWHAGLAVWAGETDINSASIGIEVHNRGHEFGLPGFPRAADAGVEALCRDIIARHGIRARARARPLRRRAHAQEGPGREIPLGAAGSDRVSATGCLPEPVNWADPGIARDAAGPLVAAVQTMLASYGYGIEATGGFDPKTEFVVSGLPAPLPARARRRPHRPVDHHHARAARCGAAGRRPDRMSASENTAAPAPDAADRLDAPAVLTITACCACLGRQPGGDQDSQHRHLADPAGGPAVGAGLRAGACLGACARRAPVRARRHALGRARSPASCSAPSS